MGGEGSNGGLVVLRVTLQLNQTRRKYLHGNVHMTTCHSLTCAIDGCDGVVLTSGVNGTASVCGTEYLGTALVDAGRPFFATGSRVLADAVI